jgi:hypothetical protein
MPLDSDITLLGTGIAPLVAAHHLILQGKKVLILNPDLDFFLEDSELPLDPLLHGTINPERILKNSIDPAMEMIRPVFPGPIEVWSNQTEKQGYHDPSAPHVRQRGRLWISPYVPAHRSEGDNSQGFPNPGIHTRTDPLWSWEQLEDLYVETSDANLNPQILEGLPAIRRFPGISTHADSFRGLHIPKLCDIDVARYRNGLLEFMREKLNPEQVFCAANQIEIIPDGIRFYSKGTLTTAKVRENMLVFWTPRLSSWVLGQSKKRALTPKGPRGIRIWEQWSLNSREQPTPSTVGMFDNMTVWADFEGVPHLSDFSSQMGTPPESSRLAVLRSGPLITLGASDSSQADRGWVSSESFKALSHLCYDFLKWDQFSIRSLRARAIFEWHQDETWLLNPKDPKVQVVSGCDGPMIQILRNVQSICEAITGGKT